MLIMRIEFVVLFFIHTLSFSQTIFINEMMSDNEHSILDADGDSSDWIELYNPGNTAVNLLDYGLTDNENDPFKWRFPDITIPPQGHLLIFASGKNNQIGAEIHCNFKIDSEGELIQLTSIDGVLLDQYQPIYLGTDKCVGRLPDGANNIISLSNHSPGFTNNLTSQILFSKQPGLYENPFYLNLESLYGDTIHYTVDGSLPTIESPQYITPIYITYRSDEPNDLCEIPTTASQELISNKAWESPGYLIDKSTIIRAQSYTNGIPSSPIYTQTFFVDEEIHSKYDLPLISLVTESSNFFDPDSGIYVPGINFEESNPEWTGNYHKTGANWERPIHIEYFDQNGLLSFAQDAGVRIHGGKTRIAAQKSLRLYARSEYGASHFNYKFFNPIETTKFKRLILRTSMGDWTGNTIIKDVLAHEITRDLDFESQAYQPVIVFLNGEYWGVHTLRERIDEDYLSYKANENSTNLINPISNETIEGSISSYHELIDFIENNNLSIQSNYEYVKSQIDISNYIDYQIAEMFLANYDWPANNVKMWKSTQDSSKWRWIFYDLDNSLKKYDYNMFVHCTNSDPNVGWPNSAQSTFMFRNLMLSSEFKNQFLYRYVALLNQTFTTTDLLDKKNQVSSLYASSVPEHSKRWNYPHENWTDLVDNIIGTFLQNRSCFVEKHLKSFYPEHTILYACETTDLNQILSMYPNPNRGSFNLYNESNRSLNARITLLSSTGHILALENNFNVEPYQSRALHFNTISAGLYFLRVEDSELVTTLKFIVNE